MANKIAGVTAVLLALVGLFFAISVLCLKTSMGAASDVNDLDGRVIRNEVRIEAVQDDISEIKRSQHSVEAKLDRVLQRGAP